MDYIKLIEDSRRINIDILEKEFSELYCDLNRLFDISHKICRFYNPEDDVLRIMGIIFTKGLITSKSIYSMIMDGRGQESGALLRNLLEIIELIKYIRLDENRINQIKEDKLPSVGRRAQLIEGDFHSLRKHLNEHSSHFKLSYHTVSHIVDINENRVVPDQVIGKKILYENIYMLCNFISFLCREKILLIHERVQIPMELVISIDEVRENLIRYDESRKEK